MAVRPAGGAPGVPDRSRRGPGGRDLLRPPAGSVPGPAEDGGQGRGAGRDPLRLPGPGSDGAGLPGQDPVPRRLPVRRGRGRPGVRPPLGDGLREGPGPDRCLPKRPPPRTELAAGRADPGRLPGEGGRSPSGRLHRGADHGQGQSPVPGRQGGPRALVGQAPQPQLEDLPLQAAARPGRDLVARDQRAAGRGRGRRDGRLALRRLAGRLRRARLPVPRRHLPPRLDPPAVGIQQPSPGPARRSRQLEQAPVRMEPGLRPVPRGRHGGAVRL